MLSPKAKNRVTASFGGGGTARTVIANEQTSARCSASVAVHDTVVVPTVNVDPDTGVQLVVTGGLPLTKVGAGKGTAMALPLVS